MAFISFHACPLAAPGEGKSGGMNVYVRQLARSLGNLGVEVDIYTRRHSAIVPDVEQITPTVRVIHLDGGHPDEPLDTLFGRLPEFLDHLNAFRLENGLEYDAVHSHYWLSGWVGRHLTRQLSIASGGNPPRPPCPHVITFHTLSLIKMQSRAGEMEPARRQREERNLIATADRVVAFSPHERDAMVRLYGADYRQIVLAPCGVDLERFHPLDREESRERLGLNGEKVLLYVGRIESLKGLDLLVHTAAHLETCQGVRVLVVGSDDGSHGEAERMRQLAEDLEVGEIFDFVGRVDQAELPWYYSAADVCVVPSFYESFGLAALESMACGTPVVASRVGGLSTVVQHGRTGYLKSWRCPEAFANSLEMILSSETLQHSMGLAARRRAEALGWDQVAGQILDIYEKARRDNPDGE